MTYNAVVLEDLIKAGVLAFNLLLPELQTIDPAIWSQLGGWPGYVFPIIGLIMLRRGDVVLKSDLERVVAAGERLYTSMLQAQQTR